MASGGDKNQKPRVVLDTNVLVSSVIAPKGNAAKIIGLWRQGQIDVVSSLPIFEEFYRVLRSHRIQGKYKLLISQIDELVQDYGELSRFVTLKRKITVRQLVDRSDLMVVATAVEGQAKFIVTGDNDLLKLGSFRGIQTTSPAKFMLDLLQQDIEEVERDFGL